MTCTQCGAAHEPHASVCAYCLSPASGSRASATDEFERNRMTIAAERCISNAAYEYVMQQANHPAVIWR